jgi:hypothetical protein
MAYGIDSDDAAIASGREKAKRAGLQDRLHLFAEDISDLEKLPKPLPTIDVAFSILFLHELLFAGPDRVVKPLRSFRNAFPGVPLVVFELLRPTPEEMRTRPGMAVQYFLQHDITNEKPVSAAEWRVLFESAGFEPIEERHLGLARTAIFTLG